MRAGPGSFDVGLTLSMSDHHAVPADDPEAIARVERERWSMEDQFLDVVEDYERRSQHDYRSAERPQYPPILAGLGVSMDQWETAIRQMSRLFNWAVNDMKRYSRYAVC
mgnify:CR=1 FL=1